MSGVDTGPSSPVPGFGLDADSDPGLSELFGVVRRRKRVLIITVVTSLVLASAYLLRTTPLFNAEALILIESEEPIMRSVQSAVAGLSGDAATIQSETYVLTSRTLADRVVQRLGLDQDAEFGGEDGSRGCLARARGDSTELENALTAECKHSKVIDRFIDRLSVKTQEQSRIISISFLSEQPRQAQAIANAVVDEYILERLEGKFESTKRINTWLNAEIEELRQNVEAAELAVEQFRQQKGLLEGNGVTLSSQELSELNTQLIDARGVTAEANARLRQVQRLVRSPDGVNTAGEVLDSPLIQRLRQQETELERRVAELASEYGELHPRMVQLRAEAQDLNENIRTEVNKVVVGLENQLGIARARENSLQRSLDELKGRVASGNQDEVQIRILEREADANRSLLTTMLARQTETRSQGDFDFQQADVRVVAPAALPSDPAYPRTRIVLGLVLFCSIFLGLLLILIFELLDDGIRSGEELERDTGVASLGFVPEFQPIGGGQSIIDDIAQNPNSAHGEAIRTLNWRLRLGAANGPPKIVLITSAHPNEGKSTVASCLATIQSLAGQRTVLIDADTRRPSVHKLAFVYRDPGLIDVLTEKAKLGDVIVKVEQSGLDVIPAGSQTSEAPGLFNSKQMDLLLDDLSESHDLIIIDTPPVMAGSDTLVLCARADATVMVVRWGESRRHVVRLAIKDLRKAGAKLAGTLLSMVNVKVHATYSYGDSGAYTGDLKEYYIG